MFKSPVWDFKTKVCTCSSNMSHFISSISSSLMGVKQTNQNDQPPVSLITQLVEHCTSISEVRALNPVLARIFFGGFFSQLLNKLHRIHVHVYTKLIIINTMIPVVCTPFLKYNVQVRVPSWCAICLYNLSQKTIFGHFIYAASKILYLGQSFLWGCKMLPRGVQ